MTADEQAAQKLLRSNAVLMIQLTTEQAAQKTTRSDGQSIAKLTAEQAAQKGNDLESFVLER